MGIMNLEKNEKDRGKIYRNIGHNEEKINGVVHEEKGNNSSKKYVFACAIFASLNCVLLGYDIGVMSGAIIFMQEDLKLTEVQEEVFVGILSIISLLGSLAGGRTSDAIGRRWTMAFAAIVFQSGAAIMSLATTFAVLMVGRLLAGIGLGFGIMIAPVYIAEISPAIERGSFTSLPEIFTNLGILLGYVSNYAFSGLPAHISWRVMLAVGIVPSVLVGFSLCIIPESPRWLVMQNRVEEARVVLLRTNGNVGEVEERLGDILKAAGGKNEGKRIDATVYYSPTIFKDAGMGSNSKLLAATMAVGLTKTLFILIAIFLIDRVGRKPLLYISTIGMTFCLFGLGITLSLPKHDSDSSSDSAQISLAILFVCGNVAFFSVGIGPICWVLSSEIFPLRLRAQAAALGAVGSRVSSGVVAMSFLSVAHAITVGGTFLVFAAISAASIVFVHKCCPETKGKSLEQIEMMFQNDGQWVDGGVELEDAQHLMHNTGR
nr:probable polyol transporter 4 [Ipomoea batatas]